MSEPVDLNAERNRRERPDPEFIVKDPFGREMFSFGIDYEFAGGQWSFQVWAYDHDDALARVAKIRETAVLAGQLMTTRPA